MLFRQKKTVPRIEGQKMGEKIKSNKNNNKCLVGYKISTKLKYTTIVTI